MNCKTTLFLVDQDLYLPTVFFRSAGCGLCVPVCDAALKQKGFVAEFRAAGSASWRFFRGASGYRI
jgi:hypothetical protein